MRNALHVLSAAYLSVSPASVAAVYHASLAAGLSAKEMLLPHAAPALCESTLRLAAEAAEAAADDDGALDEAMEDAPPLEEGAEPAPTSRLDAGAARRFVAHALAAPS